MRLRRPTRLRPLRAALSATAILSLAGAGVVPSAVVAAPKPRVKCETGEAPSFTGSGKTLRLATNAKGQARCKAAAKLVKGKVEPPAEAPQGTVASTADQITQALASNPTALAKAEKKVGKKATAALVDRTLNGWRGAAKAGATRFAADTGFHFQGDFGDAAKGSSGSATIDAGPAGENGAGIKATATIEFQADAKGLRALGADKITSGKSAGVKLEIAFEDAPSQCPTAAGRVEGKVTASATLTLTIDGQVTTVSAKVEAKYFLTVGADARWKTIDGVDVWTTFSFGATGEKTSVWRGNRSGAGFTEKGIFGGEGSKDFEGAIKEQQSHLREDLGGVWGPKGRVLYSDPSTDNIFNYGGSLDHLKGMVLTEVATRYLTFAAVEYVRQIVAPRGQKHWYDAEACLRIDGSPDKARLSPGETTKVTVKNARAFDGTPARTDQTATGVASITPGSASVAPSGVADYTLTAPGTTPVKATWNVVALSPAGKKTINGSLGGQPRYTVTLDLRERTNTATHLVTGRLKAVVETKEAVGPPPSWGGAAPVEWSDVTATSKIPECSLISPIQGGSWAVGIEELTPGVLTVTMSFGVRSWVDYTVRCVDDEGHVSEVSDMHTLFPVMLNGNTFTLPSAGGVHPIDAELTIGGGEGEYSVGSVTVTPTG